MNICSSLCYNNFVEVVMRGFLFKYETDLVLSPVPSGTIQNERSFDCFRLRAATSTVVQLNGRSTR